MARRISIASGNFTAAGTWGVVDDTSYLDSEVGSTGSTTSYVRSSAFTPGAITVDGIAVKVSSLNATLGGTVSIELWNDTGSVQVAEVTINATDIANTSANNTYNRGWYFFKFGSSQLLLAATNYKVGFKSSNTGSCTIYRDGTAGNWSRMLRTTTTGAPASGDQLHVIGEWTAAATLASFIVTMDNTATTSFGPTVSGGPPQGITIGKGGTLTFGTSASTNYYLKFKGVLMVCDGGTLNTGTSGTRIPSTSTAVLEMDSVANVDTGIVINTGGIWNGYGAQKDNFKSFLNTDEAAAATVIGITSTTDWAVGDELCFASTTRTASECEKKTILTVDSSTQITLSAGLTNAHSGTSPIQAEVGNLTRNVKVRGISDSLQGYVFVGSGAEVVLRCIEFSRLGSSTSTKRGIDVGVMVSGTFDMQYCAIRDFIVLSSMGLNVSQASGTPTITVSNNVFYNCQVGHMSFVATVSTQTINNNLCIRTIDTNGRAFTHLGGPLVSITNLTCVGSNNSNAAILLGTTGTTTNAGFVILTFADITTHSNVGYGFQISCLTSIEVLRLTSWRNNVAGVGIISGAAANVIFTDLVMFGNNIRNILVHNTTGGVGAGGINLTFRNCISSGDTTFSTTYGVDLALSTSASCALTATFIDCDFSTVTGIKTAHTSDFNLATAGQNNFVQIKLINTLLLAATEMTGQTGMHADSAIGSQKHDQTNGNHKTWRKVGTITIDTVIYDVSPSMRLTPNGASTEKLETRGVNGYFRVPIASGASITPSVKVRESVVGDGADYNGNRPRLIVKANAVLGWATDVVLDTATGAAEGAFETLTGTTATAGDDGVAELCVDCDGPVGTATGWINVDTWSIV